ncbi:hemolysin N-terminal domain-containing protein [Vibrio sp. SA48]|uniref:hemolysin N-terminal domain-containing protein n=1 Tax=Vibrio sp. S12_S33 TaxID=2720223 RepID=UPI001EE37990|nr:hemolysin N-terminal domain-containing protein [Vibrio sp. S12_S33]
MPINKNKAVSVIAMMSGLVWNTAMAEINQPQGLVIEIFSELQDDSQINYLNASYWLKNDVEPPTLVEIRDNVLSQHQRLLC